MIIYSTNWMGPISMSWFRDRGLTYTKGGSEKFSLSYGEWELLQVLMNYKESE
jgi:hypothetical protein